MNKKQTKGVKLFVDEEGGKHEKVPDKVPSIKELRDLCGRKRNIWFWRDRINRFLSIYITKLFLLLGAVPNHATFFVFLFGILSAVFYSFGFYTYSLIGLLFHHLSFVMDAVDGEVARYKKMMSLKGVYLDLMNHILVTPLILVGITIGSFMHPPAYLPFSGIVYLIAGSTAGFFYIMNNFLRVKKYEMYSKSGNFDKLKEMVSSGKEESTSWVKNEIIFLLSFEIFNLMFFFTILNLVPILVLFYGALYFVSFVVKFYRSYKSVTD